MRKVYIAGKITGDPTYRQKFAEAEKHLHELAARTLPEGAVILNPAILPEGMAYENYMEICRAMIRVSDEVVFLPDWQDSPGALEEMRFCLALAKPYSFLKN